MENRKLGSVQDLRLVLRWISNLRFFHGFFTTCVFTFYTNIYHTFAYKLCDSPHYHKILMVFHTCCFTENSSYGKSMINLRRVNVKHHTFRKNSLINCLSFWVLTCRFVEQIGNWFNQLIKVNPY